MPEWWQLVRLRSSCGFSSHKKAAPKGGKQACGGSVAYGNPVNAVVQGVSVLDKDLLRESRSRTYANRPAAGLDGHSDVARCP